MNILIFIAFWYDFYLYFSHGLFASTYCVTNVNWYVYNIITDISTHKMNFCHFCIKNMGHHIHFSAFYSSHMIESKIPSISDMIFIYPTSVISTTTYFQIFCIYKRYYNNIFVFLKNIHMF